MQANGAAAPFGERLYRAEDRKMGEIGRCATGRSSLRAATEIASVIARLTRMNSLHLDGAREIFAEFDAWSASCADRVGVTGIDVQTAQGFIRRLDLNVRAPDAINPGDRKPSRRTDRHL
jgi:hypothetical protein